MEINRRRGNFRQLEGGDRSEGERRCSRTGEANAVLDGLRRVGLRGTKSSDVRAGTECGRQIRQGRPRGIRAAASASSMPDDFRISITNAGGKDAYPIASYTWLLTPARISDPVKKRIIVDFLRWMILHGQRMAVEVGYAPLPEAVAAKVLKAWIEFNDTHGIIKARSL